MSTASTAVTQRDRYLNALLEQATQAASQSPLSLDTLRSSARALVQERTFPSNRDEEWRFTDLSSLLAIDFQVPAAPMGAVLEQAKGLLTEVSLSDVAGTLVFVNGTYAADLSSPVSGVTVLSQLDTAPENLLAQV
ncbi:MAG: Fe-S cluster assembly protein SufD, partial [Leptolyngbyaceae cyanobacterium MAG.088]|nr:Fe-S cluster assembly protein SufD [Leptolyngbyaceae cyanobacterium MAG.088]